MNHVYRTVFNRARGIYQVASELARNSGGGTTSTSVSGTVPEARTGGDRDGGTSFRLSALMAAVAVALAGAGLAAPASAQNFVIGTVGSGGGGVNGGKNGGAGSIGGGGGAGLTFGANSGGAGGVANGAGAPGGSDSAGNPGAGNNGGGNGNGGAGGAALVGAATGTLAGVTTTRTNNANVNFNSALAVGGRAARWRWARHWRATAARATSCC